MANKRQGLRIRRWVGVAIALGLSVPITSLADATAVPTEIATTFVGRVGLGDPLFWNGHHVERGIGTWRAGDPATEVVECEISKECRIYRFEVGEGGTRLRVAGDLVIDDSVRDGVEQHNKGFRLRLYDPAGQYVEGVCVDRCGSIASSTPYSAEAFATPSPGMWSVLFIPTDGEDWTYRMRAALETPPIPTKAPALPNIRMGPPFEFTFTMPASPQGPGVDLGSDRDPSCSPLDDPEQPEIIQATCLRFSAGPENAGVGPLDLRGYPAPGALTTDAYQVIYAEDRSILDAGRPAGSFRWHETHGHWHFEGYLSYELFRVVGKGHKHGAKLQDLGSSRKIGACPADERMADWERFYQDGQNSAAGTQQASGFIGHCLMAHSPGITVSAGWGDMYEWQRPEQFVPFPASDDGTPRSGDYLLRATADSEGSLEESDESDNVSYALVRVSGFDVELLDRGYGSSPRGKSKPTVGHSERRGGARRKG